MDWFTVVLIIIFFVLPVIQQVLEQARRKQQLPPGEDPGGFDIEGQGPPVGRRRAPTIEDAPGEGGWSEGWTPWPTQQEQESGMEPAAPPPSFDNVEWAPSAPPPPPLPPAPPGGTPPVLAQLPKVELQLRQPLELRTQPARLRAAAGLRPISKLPSVSQRGRPPITKLLGNARDLRRAVILREVLGPPASLRSDDGDRPT